MAQLKSLARYLLLVLIAIDQLLNTILAGHPDETFSARCWRGRTAKRRWFYARLVVDALFFVLTWQWHHCRDAYEAEQQRRQLPREYRWAG